MKIVCFKMDKKKKLKVIMIDAFKPKYLEYAPYLRSLVERNEWGELTMTAGHWGCIQVLFEGRSEILSIFRKGNGKLRWLSWFGWLEKLGKVGRFGIDVLFNLPRMLRRYEMFKTGKIPVRQLSKMEVSVKRHFAKNEWVDFFYFGELDELGHEFGPDSMEIREAVREIDESLKGMEFDLIFSDHGMVEVDKVVEVPISDDCFIDSDMARYWGSVSELEVIRGGLPLEYGSVLDWPDKRFGDLIFMANSGVLIYPNYFNARVVKGMHGYDGKDKEMRAFYLLDKNGGRKDLKVRELHEILVDMKNGKRDEDELNDDGNDAPLPTSMGSSA